MGQKLSQSHCELRSTKGTADEQQCEKEKLFLIYRFTPKTDARYLNK